ncbi:MAG: DUF58 domain-containing protein [Actinobacteria bacterium]|nr:DUF58 domain-containing protein [Actinomycetota bacterium]
MLTRRGWVGLGGGLCTYGVAWGFGAGVLVPLALALIVAPLAMLVASRRHRDESLQLSVSVTPQRPIEGVGFGVAVGLEGKTPRHGEAQLSVGQHRVTVPLVRRAKLGASGSFVSPALPRGVFAIRSAELEAGDVFGFTEAPRTVTGSFEVVVWPRWAERTERVGGSGGDGDRARRPRPARQSGYDLHGIREHQDGESLRRVDWKSSARTGRLMVRELEDASRVERTIIVDLDAATGAQGDACLDQLLRAAATAVRSAVDDRQQASLVLLDASSRRLTLDGSAPSWFAAMDALAVVRADRTLPLASVLTRDRRLASGGALTIITASAAPELVALLRAEAAHTPVRIVQVTDDPSADWSSLVAVGGVVHVVPVAAPIAFLAELT